MRGGWRSLGAALAVGAAVLIHRERDWGLLWRTDAASCIALACVVFVLGLVGALLIVAMVAWFLLAVWPARVGVRVDPGGMTLAFGPFGTQSFDWSRTGIQELADEELLIDPELAVPRITHPAFEGDLSERIARFCKVTSEQWRSLIAHRRAFAR